MTKRVAMLLNGPIKNDYRVIKVIETLSKTHEVHLFYINGHVLEDQAIFNDNVELHSTDHVANAWIKIIRHSLFCYEFNFMKTLVLSIGIPFDFVWANDLPTLYPASAIAKRLKCKLIYDSHEIYNETINQFFPRNSSGFKKIIFQTMIAFMRLHGTRIERKIFPSVDTFLTVNQSLLDHFKARNTIRKGIVIMNLPKQVQRERLIPVNYKEKFAWDTSAFVSIYQGQLNEGRGLQLLFESFQHLPEQYKLVVVGNGSLGVSLQQWTLKHSMIERIKFIETVPLEQLSSYTAGADLGINLLERFNLSKEYASPNKLFEYIHAEIPVVASETIENQRVFNNYPIGRLTKNHPREIAAAILAISSQNKADFYDAISQAKSHYHWENQVELLNSVLAD